MKSNSRASKFDTCGICIPNAIPNHAVGTTIRSVIKQFRIAHGYRSTSKFIMQMTLHPDFYTVGHKILIIKYRSSLFLYR